MSPDSDLPGLADRALAWIRKRSQTLKAEVYISRGRDRGVELKEGRLEALQESSEEGIGLRLVDGSRMGFASAGGLGDDVLPEIFRRALDQVRHLPPDEARDLPAGGGGGHDEALAGSLFDPGAFGGSLESWVPRLKEMEARALAADRRLFKALHASYGESRGSVAIASTEGVRTFETGTSASAALSLAAKDGDEVQVGSACSVGRRADALDLERVAREAATRATALLKSRKLPSRQRSVLFDPWVAGEFLDMLSGALSADAVQRGRSLFKDRLGTRVAAPLVTFLDDPRRPGGIASALYDDEGVPTRRKAMIEGGVLREFFHDAYTARREGRASNGCAGRAGFKGMPGPASSNFYLAPGPRTRESLLKETRDGILVLEIMGMHTADSVSGEFSVGVSGLAVLGGEVAHGVRGAMISANLLDVLQGVDAVADDLAFYGGTASPTFRVGGLTVA